MASKLDPRLLEILLPKPAPEPLIVPIWGVVTGSVPLRVRLAGDDNSLPVTPKTLVAGLAVGDPVWCVRQSTELLIVGRVGGKPAEQAKGGVYLICSSNPYQAATFPIVDWPAGNTYEWGDFSFRYNNSDTTGVNIRAGMYRFSAVFLFDRTGDRSTFNTTTVRRYTSDGQVRGQVVGLGQPNNRMIAGITTPAGATNVEHTAPASVTTTSVTCQLTIERLGD